MRRIPLLVVLVVVAATLTETALAVQSPVALRASILNAARAQRSVHYVNQQSFGVHGLRMVCDVAAGDGIQRITFTEGARSGRVTVEVVDRVAYVRGDAFTLRNYMLFPSTQASRYANRWIKIPSSSPGYSTVAAGVTLGSLVQLLDPKGTPLRVAGTVGGHSATGVRVRRMTQGKSYVMTLWASATGKPLPLEETVSAKGNRSKLSLDRWNEPVHVEVPARAVPIATVVHG